MKTFALLFVGACVLASPLLAADDQTQMPESYIALLRSGVQTQKAAIVAQNLTLSDEQAQKFWPMQRKYENDLAKLNGIRFQIIREYANSWTNLSDRTAKDLGKRLIAFQKKRIAFQKDTSPIIAAKFFHIESQNGRHDRWGNRRSVPLIQQSSERHRTDRVLLLHAEHGEGRIADQSVREIAYPPTTRAWTPYYQHVSVTTSRGVDQRFLRKSFDNVEFSVSAIGRRLHVLDNRAGFLGLSAVR